MFYTEIEARVPLFLGPTQLDLRDPEQLALAILKTQSK